MSAEYYDDYPSMGALEMTSQLTLLSLIPQNSVQETYWKCSSLFIATWELIQKKSTCIFFIL